MQCILSIVKLAWRASHTTEFHPKIQNNPTSMLSYTQKNKYDVLVSVSTRKHFGKCVYSLKCLRRTYILSFN